MPNVGRMNALSFFPVAMLNTSVFAFMNFMQPYILSEHLGIARGIQGTVVGSISTMQELIILSLTALMGALADKLGRQPIFSLGLLLMSVAYFCFPLATELYHLYLIRALFAIGVAAASTVLIIYTGDYPQEKSRAKWNGFMGLFQGLGITITSLFLAKMPAAFQEKGFDAIQSGTYTLWIGTAICLTAAIFVATMLKPGSKQSKPSRASLKDLFRDGLSAAKSDSRIRLAFLASAAARGDIFVVGIFTFLWMSNFALDNGLSINQGYARGAFVIPIIAGTVLITAPIFGFIMDRIDRIYGVMIAFSLSTIGYTMMGLVDDPMSNAIIPVAIILGAGEGACIIASTTLIGKTAPIAIRGTVFGAFAMCGAIGQIIAGGVGGILFDYIYFLTSLVLIYN